MSESTPSVLSPPEIEETDPLRALLRVVPGGCSLRP